MANTTKIPIPTDLWQEIKTLATDIGRLHDAHPEKYGAGEPGEYAVLRYLLRLGIKGAKDHYSLTPRDPNEPDDYGTLEGNAVLVHRDGHVECGNPFETPPSNQDLMDYLMNVDAPCVEERGGKVYARHSSTMKG